MVIKIPYAFSEIYIGSGIFRNHLRQLKKQYDKVIVVTQKNLASLHLLSSQSSDANVIYVPQGEKAKDIKVYTSVISKLLKNKVGRKSCLVAFGGGVVGDLAGFVAATYMRGMTFVQIPTTLIAQVDAAVGGKNAINTSVGKNLIGTFYHPTKVIIDISVLDSLPEDEYLAGLAEVIKYALIGDKSFLVWLMNHHQKIKQKNVSVLKKMIQKCIKAKIEYVSADVTDTKNVRALLNFGHTFGHAIEALSKYKVKHGQAVALGMLLASYYSTCYQDLHKEAYDLIKKTLDLFCLPNISFKKEHIHKILNLMMLDKKNNHNTLSLIALENIGQAKFVNRVSRSHVRSVLKQFLHQS